MKNANIQTVKLNLSKAPTKRLKRTEKKKKKKASVGSGKKEQVFEWPL